RPIALVSELLDDVAAQFASAAFDGPLDVVLGHADGAGLVDGVAELEVHFRVAAAVPGRDDNRPAQLAEQLTPLGVYGPFLVLDRCPVRMARHGRSLNFDFDFRFTIAPRSVIYHPVNPSDWQSKIE